jgi:hypothetical protein
VAASRTLSTANKIKLKKKRGETKSLFLLLALNQKNGKNQKKIRIETL